MTEYTLLVWAEIEKAMNKAQRDLVDAEIEGREAGKENRMKNQSPNRQMDSMVIMLVEMLAANAEMEALCYLAGTWGLEYKLDTRDQLVQRMAEHALKIEHDKVGR
jgi:hypothetical protein